MYPRATVAARQIASGAPPPPPPPPPPTISVSISPPSTAGYVSGTGAAWSGTISVTGTTGDPPLSYSWSAGVSQTSGPYSGGVGISIAGQGSSSASFGVFIPANTVWQGTFSVTVTDANGYVGSAGGDLDFYASA